VFVERLWRSVKYEEVYRKAYDSVSEARASIGRYLAFYNQRRPHSSLDRHTPDEAYFDRLQSWRRYLREFGGLAKVDRIGGYAAKFSRSISIP